MPKIQDYIPPKPYNHSRNALITSALVTTIFLSSLSLIMFNPSLQNAAINYFTSNNSSIHLPDDDLEIQRAFQKASQESDKKKQQEILSQGIQKAQEKEEQTRQTQQERKNTRLQKILVPDDDPEIQQALQDAVLAENEEDKLPILKKGIQEAQERQAQEQEQQQRTSSDEENKTTSSCNNACSAPQTTCNVYSNKCVPVNENLRNGYDVARDLQIGGPLSVVNYAFTPEDQGIPASQANIYFSDTLDTAGGIKPEGHIISMGHEWQGPDDVDYHTTIVIWDNAEYANQYREKDTIQNKNDLSHMVNEDLFAFASEDTISLTQAEDGTIKLEFVMSGGDESNSYTYLVNFKIKDWDTSTEEGLQAAIDKAIEMGLDVTDSLIEESSPPPPGINQIREVPLIQSIIGKTYSFIIRVGDFFINPLTYLR